MATIKTKFTMLIALLGFTEIVSTADGSYLQNEHLEAIDSALLSNKSEIETLTADKTTMATLVDDLKSQLSTAQQSVTDLTNSKTSLEAEVSRLNAIVARQPENNKPLGKTGEEGVSTTWVENSAGWDQAQKDLETRIF